MRFLLVDSILPSPKGPFIHGVKHITPDCYYLTEDITGRSYFIPSFIGEALGQLAAWHVMESLDFQKRPVAGIVARAVLHRPAYVGETVQLASYIDDLDDEAVQYHSVARVDDEVIFTIEGALGPLLPMGDFIAEDDVRRQFFDLHGEKENRTQVSEATRISPLIFDAMIASEPGAQLSAIKHIHPDAPYFSDHFPRKPVLPLTVLLACQFDLAREFLKRANFQSTYSICEMRRIKMNEFVVPGEVLTCHVSVKQQDEQKLVLSFRSEVGNKRVCMMEMLLAPMSAV